MRSRTAASICAGDNPGGNADVDTMVRVRASGGKSHSKVTPTTESPAPIANRISVVDGNNETIRIAGAYEPSEVAGQSSDQMRSAFHSGLVTGVTRPSSTHRLRTLRNERAAPARASSVP